MYCFKCGHTLPNEAVFCNNCGNRITMPDQPVKQKNQFGVVAAILGGLLILSVAFILLSQNGVLSNLAGNVADPKRLATNKENPAAQISSDDTAKSASLAGPNTNFGTQEQTISYFVENLKAAKLEGMLSACAAKEMSAGFVFNDWAKRAGVISQDSPLPSEYSLFNEVNAVSFLPLGQLKYIFTYIALHSNMDGDLSWSEEDIEQYFRWDPVSIGNDPEKVAQEFIKACNPEVLSELSSVRCDYSCPNMQDTEKNQANYQRIAATYGADDMEEWAILYECNGKYFMSGFMLLHYNSGWKIKSFDALLAGIPTYGIMETTMEEYMRRVIDPTVLSSAPPDIAEPAPF